MHINLTEVRECFTMMRLQTKSLKVFCCKNLFPSYQKGVSKLGHPCVNTKLQKLIYYIFFSLSFSHQWDLSLHKQNLSTIIWLIDPQVSLV